ncbi:MAG: type II toxin-antitoxin system HicB family antitoxin [Dehalococcoidia bacterium]
MDLEYYLAVPYVLTMESVRRPDGEWVRRAEYEELPGCVVEAYSAVEAITRLDEARVRCIQGLLERGEPVPVPRPPLLDESAPLDAQLLFAHWLMATARHGE